MDAVLEMSLFCMEQDLMPAIEADAGGVIKRIGSALIRVVTAVFRAISTFARNCYKTFKTKLDQLRKKKANDNYKDGMPYEDISDAELTTVKNELMDALNWVDDNVTKYLNGAAKYATDTMKMMTGDSPVSDEAFDSIIDRHESIVEEHNSAVDGIKRLSNALNEYMKYPLYTKEVIDKMSKVNDLFNSIYQTYDGALMVLTHFATKANNELFKANGTPDYERARDKAIKLNRVAGYIEKDLGDAKKVIVSFGTVFSQFLSHNAAA